MKSLFKKKIGAADLHWMTDGILNNLHENKFIHFTELYHPETFVPAEGYLLSYNGTDVFIYDTNIIVYRERRIVQDFEIGSNFIEAFNKIEMKY